MSNEEAVKMLRTMQRTVYLGNRKFEDAIECAIKALSEPLQPWEVLAAQSVLPQPKRGKWIDRGEHGDWEWQADGRGKHWHEWECNTCHHYYAERSFFCPHCGADMREVTT